MALDSLPQAPPTDNPFESWIISTLTHIATNHENFRTELLGNGQPGRIQRIEDDLEDTKKVFGKKYDSVNGRLWKISGGLAVLGAIGITLLKKALSYIGIHL